MIELTFINSVAGLGLLIGVGIILRSLWLVFLDDLLIGLFIAILSLWVML